jgi:hypothetical protein
MIAVAAKSPFESKSKYCCKFSVELINNSSLSAWYFALALFSADKQALIDALTRCAFHNYP